MSHPNPHVFKHRAWTCIGMMACMFFLILCRAYWIQFFSNTNQKLNRTTKNQYANKILLKPYRGGIYDRKGTPLALSIISKSVAINPMVFDFNHPNALHILHTLEISQKKITLLKQKHSHFVWIKRKLHPESHSEIINAKLPGLHIIDEPTRYYPYNTHASQLLGSVNIDHQGQFGLERFFEQELKGEALQLDGLKDAKGHSLHIKPNPHILEHSGNNVFLTLDMPIQQITEKALEEAYLTSGAKSAFALVEDPHTGRIYAMANFPAFNPNEKKKFNIEHTINHAAVDLFEPGSIIKPFIIAKALDTGKTTAQEIHSCEKSGTLSISPKHTIHDDHPTEFLSTEDVLVYSSNICTYKIAKRLGKETIRQTLLDFGFAKSKNILPVPGRQYGFLSSALTWPDIQFANIAFGQGFITSGIELIQGYNALANGGYLVEPFILERIESPDGRTLSVHKTKEQKQRLLSPSTVSAMKLMLTSVVKRGTGKLAFSEKISLAGKTGTSQKVDPLTRQYSPHLRTATFMGFAPAQDPHLVILVVIDEPQKKPYYGGIWAAPVAKKIAEESLQYLNVLHKKQAISLKPPTPTTLSRGAPLQ